MAKQRMINTKMWDDSYFSELKPTEKLLFVYLLTNSLTNISWIYEIQLKRITFDTWLNNSDLKKILDKFKDDWKIYFFNDYIMIKNFIKNQNINPSVIKWIIRELSEIEENILQVFFWLNKENLTSYVQGGDSLSTSSIELGLLNLTKPNLTKLTRDDLKKELEKFIWFWNENFTEKRTVTPDLILAYQILRNKYTKEELWRWANKFFKDKKWEEKQYQLTPIKFFKQSNWLPNYL